MIAANLEREYKAARQQRGITASQAIGVARSKVAEAEADYLTHNVGSKQVSAWREGPLLVVVTCEPEEYPEPFTQGTFRDTWGPSAVKHSEGGREYRWWVPDEGLEARAEGFRSSGYSKQAAFERAAQTLREDYLFACDPPCQYVITAEVYLSAQEPEDLFAFANSVQPVTGPRLGIDSCGGFFACDWWGIHDVAAQALAQAQEAIAAIKQV